MHVGWFFNCTLTLNIFQCFVFHLYKGVRAGGGVGDELEPPDGDPLEAYRILFDISFFFFIVVILLAIIQGIAAMNSIIKVFQIVHTNIFIYFNVILLNLRFHY